MSSSLSEHEKELITKIGENNVVEVKLLLGENDVRVNSYDENGMTLLQHAAYKGNYEISKLLLERGAHVNSNSHVHGYSALMFAALGGQTHRNVVNLLLESGADVSAVNSVGRNASQMAAFVGQHDSVSIINNFIPRSDIEYYTQKQGLETEARLPLSLVGGMHSLVCQTNIHPVRIALFLRDHWQLIENGKKVANVLESLCEKQFKKREPNEMLAIKFHHLSFVINQIMKQLKINQGEETIEDKKDGNAGGKEWKVKQLELLIKSWLKARESDAFPVMLEKMLRQSVREFPYHDSALLQQLVRTLAGVEIGQEPSAITILSQTINGQKGFDQDSPICGSCGETNPSKKCSQCKLVAYCGQECQKLHWFTHKKFCKRIDKQENKTVKEEQLLEHQVDQLEI